MRVCVYSLIVFYVLVEAFIRANIFKPVDERHIPIQRNFALLCLEMTVQLAAIGALCLLFPTCRFSKWSAALVLLVFYTIAVREAFLCWQIRRLQKKKKLHQTWSGLRKQVRRPASMAYAPYNPESRFTPQRGL